jgi:hypothetical protein
MVRVNKLVVETSAGEPLISTRPFAVNEVLSLAGRNDPTSEGPSLVIQKYATVLHPTILLLSPYIQHTNNTMLQKPSVPNIM